MTHYIIAFLGICALRQPRRADPPAATAIARRSHPVGVDGRVGRPARGHCLGTPGGVSMTPANPGVTKGRRRFAGLFCVAMIANAALAVVAGLALWSVQ